MIETYYRMLKHDPDGVLVKDTGLIKSHSYVIQFLELMRAAFDSPGNVNATDVAGAENFIYSTPGAWSNNGRVDAAADDDTYGIVVGTNAGASPEDNEDFALDTKIADGAGAGQLNYEAVTFVVPRVVGANIDADVTRTFPNTSGGPITVKEIGIICKQLTVTKYFLLLRDVVADEVVANGFTLTVIYVLRTTA